MAKNCCVEKDRFCETGRAVLLFVLLAFFTANQAVCGQEPQSKLQDMQSKLNLKRIPFKLVYETYRKTGGKQNWELYLINADGSDPVNLTNTPRVDEMYPHVSPDGKRICLVADELLKGKKTRNVCYMNIDGTGRSRVAENARQPCWGPKGNTIAYLKGEFARYTIKDYATKGLFFYNIRTGKHTEHPNGNLHHLYNTCWSPDGDWFLATVHGGMGFKHAILAFRAGGTKVFDLTKYKVEGCRPDFSPDGNRITWGKSDWDLCAGRIDFPSNRPRVSNVNCIVHCGKKSEVYHSDFSPDGKYIAFSHGPKANEMVGGKAPGWNICIRDMKGRWAKVTTDGHHNKEPDWVPVRSNDR